MDYLTDPEFTIETITSVREETDGYDIGMGSTHFYSPGKTVIPQEGDTAKLFGKGLGYVVRGLVINDQLVFYKTVEQERLDFLKEQSERDQRKRDEYVANKAELEARIAALPSLLRQRIARFQINNPDFNWKFLPYELCVLEVTTLITQLEAFNKLPYKEQVAILPEIDNMGLSGNQWGAAVHYAAMLMSDNPEIVVEEHGSLCPLVGCKEFGCVPHAS